MNRKKIGLVAVGTLCASAAFGDLTDYVDPFVGTSATGHTFPGACVPFGMVQASPDGGTESWHYCSGYRYEDREIKGFSQTHLNGTGGCELGDVRILPLGCGGRGATRPTDFSARIDKSSERAKPGYYAVTLTDSSVRVEVTASERAAIYRFTFEKGAGAHLLLDTQWGIVNGGNLAKYVLESSLTVEGRTRVVGWKRTHNWNLRETGFVVEFDHPLKTYRKLLKSDAKEKGERYVFDFDLKDGETLMVKVGLAAGKGAKANLEAEIPGWDFDAVRNAARQKWNKVLGTAVIEGTDDQKKNWYTSLYHLCIQPNNIADVGEKPFYSTFSCWDTFRAAGPMYTILYPEKAAEFVDSMLEQGKKTGYLPIWTLWGRDNQCMIGTHSVPMIVDAWLKGIWPQSNNPNNRTIEQCYAQIKETLTKKHEGREKENWDLYDQYGYYPFDLIKGESVSRTMECAYDDWCAAQMAEKLGHKEDAAFFFKRSAYWKNVFDPSLGLVRGKDTKGNWREPFDPYALGHGADRANDFTEGNAFQYSWHVMQDVPGIVAAMGGREKFVAKLDSLFKAPSKTEGMGELVDVTGLIGQYVHGNEPSHHVIYFYPQVGHPEKAAERIREVFDKFYLPKPDGLCGNDDCGQMSAWYLFSAMGFYPFNPCGGEYVLGAPQIEKVTLHCRPTPSTYTSFTVLAKGLSKENKYVKSVTLNGKPITDWKIRHEDIVKG
ncbi:MAG: GH92 family glycosyl hydrolase, partial [Kiritimatiellae bacterium]|nr:GH92 family glycosyl hydrolase [Kiritimatiellia bacterium]